MNALLLHHNGETTHVGTAPLSPTATQILVREYEALGYEVTEVAA